METVSGGPLFTAPTPSTEKRRAQSDGTLWAWGWNSYGQLGDGSTAYSAVPILVRH
jgi:hypothetical protein